MPFQFNQILHCLPLQTVVANKLAVGDVAFIHNHWMFISETEARQDMVQPQNFVITDFDTASSYVLPDERIDIIQRDLLDRSKIDALVKKLVDERAEWERIRAEMDNEDDDPWDGQGSTPDYE